jgi:redox-sensitive bicupin YhaK (pirin superfamily)
MSGTLPSNAPASHDDESASVELLIDARPRDIGGFAVRRALPSVSRRLVGPFVFFDHMGPAELAPGAAFDVRPHPHIGLATVTYLFDGEIVHRDSVGSVQPIRPGDVNWMVAGRGIAHSERTSAEARLTGSRIHGIQSWVALPLDQEEMEPRFEHHAARSVPTVQHEGAHLDVIAGTAYGARSPVGCLSPTLYVHGRLDDGARLAIDDEHEERAVYIVDGGIVCDGRTFVAGTMVVLRSGAHVEIEAREPSRVMLIGGAKLAGDRIVWWNFVASSKERLERAKDDWEHRRFAAIPGDDVEFIPLPKA